MFAKYSNKQQRLIYFASPNEGSSAGIKAAGFKKTEALTDNQKRQIRELGLKETQFKGASALDSRILDKLHKNDTLRDGTYPKDPRNPHFLLMKAIEDGKFPNRGSQIPRFLEAIEGGENERKEALKTLKEIHKLSGPLVEKQQDKYLARLDEAQAKDTVEAAKKAAEDTVSVVETRSEADVTKGKVGAVAKEAMEESQTLEKGGIRIGNWEVTPPREGLFEELSSVAQRYRKADKKYRKAYEECEKTATELKTPGLDSAKKEALTTRLHNIEQEKLTIEREMEQIKQEARKLRDEYDTWVVRTMKMFKKFETLLSESGIDLRDAKILNRWLFNQLSLDNPASSSLEIGGTVTSSNTGLSTKEYGKITITKVDFDKLDLPPGKSLDEELRLAIGQLMVEFQDEQGVTSTVSYVNFLKMVNGEEIYEEMDLEACNERIGEETFHKDLEAGDKFTARIVKDFNDDGEEVYGDEKFTIESVEKRGGKTIIVLDRTVTKTEKERLAVTTHPALYFDRKQREFSPGEFAKYVKQHNFERELTAQDDDQEIADRAAAAHKRQADKYGLPSEPAERLVLPEGGSQTNATIYSDSGESQQAFIDNQGGGSYNIQVLAPIIPRNWQQAEEAEFFAGRGKTENLQINPPSEGYTIRQIPLSHAALMESVNKGDITGEKGAENAPNYSHDENGNGATPEPAAEQIPNAHDLNLDDDQAKYKAEQQKLKEAEEAVKTRPEPIKEEALAYNQIYKVGGMKITERKFLRRLWDSTRFLSVSDLWAMGKAGYDYYQRRWDRNQKDKYSSIGEDLPYFGSEMRRIKQAAENEEVHQFHESFAKKGVFEIEERLRVTRNKDEMKACIEDLTEKGHIRWDDIDMWKNLNRFVDDPSKLIPIPSNGDPYTRLSEHDDRTGLDMLQPAIDSIWGESTYDDWHSKDKSTRQSGARKYYERGKELEIIQGGHEKALEKLLRRHINGEFVDPQEYEGLILHMIDAGKSTMQSKLYYIVAGAVAENHHGHTILSFDRIGHINSEMLAQFPILEYLATDPPREGGPEGKPKKHRWTKDDYKMWFKYFNEGDPTNCKPTQATDDFLWRYIIPSYENETRTNKDLRNADKLDHDDMFAYLPPASTAILTNACRTVGGGGKHLLTSEGYANAAPGFSQYIKTLALYGNLGKLRQAVQSFVRYESILMDRWEKGHKDFYRMDKNTLNRKTVVSDTPPIVFFKEIDEVMRKIGNAYASTHPGLREAIELQQTDSRGWDMNDRENQAKQRRIQNTLERFDDILEDAIASDNGQKMMDVINDSELTGMPFGTTSKRRSEVEAGGSEFDKSGGAGGGHGGHH